MTLYFDEEVMVKSRREIIAREFRALAAVLGAVIDELKQVDAFGGIGVGVALVIGVFEIVAERVTRETEQQARRAGTFDWFNRPDRTGIEQAEPSQCETGLHGAFQKFSSRGGLHEGSNTGTANFCQSNFC